MDLEIAHGEFFALLGASGSGKTTILRMIAGFIDPTGGEILVEGKNMSGVPPYLRPVNTMFQSYALFPHMSVATNIEYGLKKLGLPREERKARTDEMLRLVRLTGFEDRKPHQLSGGQRQRVALARAIARRPKLLLLDEPLGALDRRLRQEMQLELKRIQRESGITFLVVTHDQEEALSLADRIAIVDAGRLCQCGTPQQLYDRPGNRFVATFLGTINMLDGIARGSNLVELACGTLIETTEPVGASNGAPVCLAIRPEHVSLSARRPGNLPAQVAGGAFFGKEFLVRADTKAAAPVSFYLPGTRDLPAGEVHLALDPAAVRIVAP
ncbi:MAG: ABC transporter ATP-binding protein [Pseudomonadota bacterium]